MLEAPSYDTGNSRWTGQMQKVLSRFGVNKSEIGTWKDWNDKKPNCDGNHDFRLTPFKYPVHLGQGNVFTPVCQSFRHPWIDTPLGRCSPPHKQTYPQADTSWIDTLLGRHPLLSRHHPPHPHPRWQLKRAVRILLECILVHFDFSYLTWCHIFKI